MKCYELKLFVIVCAFHFIHFKFDRYHLSCGNYILNLKLHQSDPNKLKDSLFLYVTLYYYDSFCNVIAEIYQ